MRTRAILEKADAAELYSLDGPEGPETKELFRGSKVLGKTAITGEKARRAVLDQVLKSFSPPVKTKRAWLLAPPWHGLRVKQGDKSVDLLINFRWRWLTAHVGKEDLGRFTISREAQAALAGPIQAGKLPIADGRKEEEKPSVAKILLEKGELVEVYSLEPEADEGDKGEQFHGYKVLGKVPVKDAERRKQLTGEIAEAVVPDVYFRQVMTLCFSPRHAYRMRDNG
jgi:hypothetical protein